MPETPADLVILPRNLATAFRCLQDVPILHFAKVTKVNRRGKRQQRFIVISSTHMYSCMENGSIQRCVGVSVITEAHVWSSGQTPQLALRIPTEYDMLLFFPTSEDIWSFIAALNSAIHTSNNNNNNNVNKLRVVELTDVISAAAFRLERPKGFQRTMASALQWCIGSVGKVPASLITRDALKPFINNNNNNNNSEGDLFLLSAAVEAPFISSPPSGDSSSMTALWESALPLDDNLLEATHTMRGSGVDYSEEEETDTASFSPSTMNTISPDPTSAEVSRQRESEEEIEMKSAERVIGNGKLQSNDINNNNNIDSMNEKLLVEAQEKLLESQFTLLNEREQWCLLLAAERRNTYQLRQAISDLREQVLNLTSQNLALRVELLGRNTG